MPSKHTAETADALSGYQPLRALLGAPAETERFLPLAIRISAALSELHNRDIIHKNITPDSILVNTESGAVVITDSTLSSILPNGHPMAHTRNLFEELFTYMSPEQTGRMNRIIDHRSDLYSLGIVLYEMAAGRPPFQAGDALEWVHCHIARQPVPPSELFTAIPKQISDIIMKLLAKTAEERYQTAAGLKYDLEICLARLESGKEIELFPLGEGDVSDRMLIPQKLYGREQDVATLYGTFERVAASGTPELIMISGYSGVGKTSLVRELYKPIVRENGLFISGKFDQYKSNIPYSTFGDAFRELIRQILTESEESIAAWRAKLLNALGLNGQLIVDIIPQLEVIIGEQPPVPELSPSDAASRFNTLFLRFIGVFTTPEHPLVLFLDDLQWADAASLKLLENIITDDMRYLFIIGAFRDNEVNPSHPLILTLDSISRNHAPLQTITLLPLTFTDLGQLLIDTFHPHECGFESLSSLIYEKTVGNPFFVTQFLITLHEESLVEFDRMKSVWKWDAGRIHAKGYSDNVVDLILGKLRKLSPETRQTLQLAACIGNSFDLGTLLSISSISDSAIVAALKEALQERLILRPADNSYSFLHDRVQQAAYSLIPEGEKVALHLQIGRLMLAAAAAEEIDEKVFDIVNQFDRGVDLIVDQDERLQIARLNLIAGKKAKASTAYAAALNYLSLGAQLLDENSWEVGYRLCFEINQELAEAEYLNSKYDLARELIERLVTRAASDLERARLYNILIVQYTLLANYPDAIRTGREALRLLHVIVPETDLQGTLDAELRRYAEVLGTRDIPSLADEPECSDPEKRVCLELLSNMVVPARYTDSTLFALISVLNVNTSLQFGPTPKSTVGYSAFGMVLNSALGNFKDAYAFGLVALQLSERFNVPAQKCQASFMLGHYLNQWVRHLKWADATLNDGIQAGLASGEMQWTGYSMAYKLFQPFYRGEKLELVRNELPSLLFFTRKTVNRWATDTLVGLELALSELTKPDVSSEYENEAAFLAECRERRSFGAIGRYAVLKAQIHYLYGRLNEASEAVATARELSGFFSSSISVAELNFYDSLILAALFNDSSSDVRAAQIGKIRENQLQMRIWADNCPENFSHQYQLVEAELARLEGRDLEAMRFYEQSIESAREHGFIQDKGVANELAARFYRQLGFATSADAYLRQARSCYLRWGADIKVKELDRENNWLQYCERSASTNDIDARIAGLDAMTVIKASQAISGKIILSDLLKTLMTVVLENAGAQRGCLLLMHGGQLSLAAEARVESDEIKVDLDNTTAFTSLLPQTMVNYVRRTQECLILEDAAANELFAADPYIVQQLPLSTLCLPLVRQGSLIGMLYLENSLVSKAFNAEMVAVLELLGAQAAISLENAVLYQERGRAEGALRQSEEKYRAIFEHCGTALIFIEEDTTISMCNMKFELLSGLKRTELEGRKKWSDFVAHQEDLNRMKEYHRLRRVNPQLAPQSYEFQFLSNQGVLKDVAVTVTTIPETRQSLAVMIDITERKRGEEELIRLATAFEQAAEGIFITDTAFNIQYVNPACLRITGYTKEEFIGQHTRILKSGKHDRTFFRRIMAALNQVGAWSGHMTLKRKDGTIYEAEVTNTAVRDFSGATINYVCIHRDITNELKLERELRQSQKMEAIGTLAGGIAHDFNNILTAIFGYTNMAIRKLGNESLVGRDLGRVLEASSRAADLVRQILTFSRQSEQEKKPVHVALIIDEVLKLLRSSIPSTIEIRRQVTTAPEKDLVLADPTQIHQVLMNLGTNAAHAMREHGGVLGVELSDIDVDASLVSLHPDLESGPCLRLTVSDTGHGMDAAVRERIFDPYFTTKKVGEGTGMGMAVVQGIIKNHGGAISVYSEPGQGSTFHIFLPKINYDITHETTLDESYAGGTERILFVDDEAILTEMGQELLESLGYRVTATTNSLEALKAFMTDPSAFDLVITDMTMPGLTGKELALELLAARPDIPIILCTGFCEEFNGMKGQETGIRELVMKPYSLNDLDKIIRKVLA